MFNVNLFMILIDFYLPVVKEINELDFMKICLLRYNLKKMPDTNVSSMGPLMLPLYSSLVGSHNVCPNFDVLIALNVQKARYSCLRLPPTSRIQKSEYR